jgi:hypothetical protein
MAIALRPRRRCQHAAHMCVTGHAWCERGNRCQSCSGSHGTANMQRMCVTRHACMLVRRMCVSQHNRERMCVSQDTPGLRGRADVSRARDLDGAASMQRVRVSPDTPGLRGRADGDRAQDLDGAASMQRICVSQGCERGNRCQSCAKSHGAASMQRM